MKAMEDWVWNAGGDDPADRTHCAVSRVAVGPVLVTHGDTVRVAKKKKPRPVMIEAPKPKPNGGIRPGVDVVLLFMHSVLAVRHARTP
ncbi:MAG: hypothetical protein GY906_38535 [bacterium]|nr:hypothetical protein [bacterium]